MLPKFLANVGYWVIAFAFAKKLRAEELPEELIEPMREFKEVSLRRHSVIDVAQILPFWVPQLIDPQFCLHKRFKQLEIPLAIAFGDRDFLCSRGAD